VTFAQDDSREPRPAGPVTDDGGALRAGGSSTPPSSVPPAGGSSIEDVQGSGAGAPPGADKSGEGQGAQVEHDIEALLADTEQARDEYLELAKRTQADFENYRKRMAAEVQAAAARAKVEVAREIVPVVDHFELALQHSGIDTIAALAAKEDNAIEAGWVMTYNDLHNALKQVGVEVIDPKGEKFDPTVHEALSTQAVGSAAPGTVVEVMQKGYRLEDQLIRPARVVVSE
jgi:molecular chaperone GrpE